jgi:hypothetical protein
MAKAKKARKVTAMEPFAIFGKGSLPQLTIQSLTRAVADDEADIRRYASTLTKKKGILLYANIIVITIIKCI